MRKGDINVKIEDYTLNCRATAIVIHDGKILFQKRKEDKYWALPGGKISVGDTSKTTVERELQEEINLKDFQVEDACTISEYFFEFNKEKFHQYIFGHKVEIYDRDILSKEEFDGVEPGKNIIYKWIKIKDLKSSKIKPDFLVEQLKNIEKHPVQFISYKE